MHELVRSLLQCDSANTSVERFTGIVLQRDYGTRNYPGVLWIVRRPTASHHLQGTLQKGGHACGNTTLSHEILLHGPEGAGPFLVEDEAPAFSRFDSNSFFRQCGTDSTTTDFSRGGTASRHRVTSASTEEDVTTSGELGSEMYVVWTTLSYLEHRLPLMYAVVEAEFRDRHQITHSPLTAGGYTGPPKGRFAGPLYVTQDASPDDIDGVVCVRATQIISVFSEVHHVSVRDRRIQAITLATMRHDSDGCSTSTPSYTLVFQFGGSVRFLCLLKMVLPPKVFGGDVPSHRDDATLPTSGDPDHAKPRTFPTARGRPVGADHSETSSSSFLDLAADYAPPVPTVEEGLQDVPPHPPLTADVWNGFFVGSERELGPGSLDKARRLLFHGGVEDSVRLDVWLHLLGVYPAESTAALREETMAAQRRQYEALLGQWEAFLPVQVSHWTKLRQYKHYVEVDVTRTDRANEAYRDASSPKLQLLRRMLCAHILYNFDLGYCQGMSDIAAIVGLLVGPRPEDECAAYACLKALLAGPLQTNFTMDPLRGVSQLMREVQILVRHFAPELYRHLQDCESEGMAFSFRWLLTWFKREYTTAETMCLWDTMLSSPCNRHYDVVMVSGLLKRLAPQIIGTVHSCDEMLKYANNLSKGNVSVTTLKHFAWTFYEDMCLAATTMLDVLPDNCGLSVLSWPPTVEEVTRLCLAIDGDLQ